MNQTLRYRIALVDDHRFFTEGLKSLLLIKFNDKVSSIEEYSNPINLIDNIESKVSDPQIIFMDIDMPEMCGIEATRRILALNPKIKIIAVTQFTDGHNAKEMFKAGAYGYIPKSTPSDELAAVFESIKSGEKYITPEMIFTYTKHSIAIAGEAKPDSAISNAKEGYTPRMLVVIRGINDGKTDKEIASVLGTKAKTVEYDKRKIMKKMGVNKAAQIVGKAYELGLLP